MIIGVVLVSAIIFSTIMAISIKRTKGNIEETETYIMPLFAYVGENVK